MRRRERKPIHSYTNFLVETIEHLKVNSLDQFTKSVENQSIMASKLTRKELLSKVYKMVPPMLEKFHKGVLRKNQINQKPSS
jgi:hypothetical protein